MGPNVEVAVAVKFKLIVPVDVVVLVFIVYSIGLYNAFCAFVYTFTFGATNSPFK